MKDIFDKPGKKGLPCNPGFVSFILFITFYFFQGDPKRMEKVRKSSRQIGESRQDQKLQRHSKKQAQQAFRQY